MTEGPVVVVGTGQAGLQLGLSLRELRFKGSITLVGDEPGLPYQRPPLSKAYLTGLMQEGDLVLRRAEVLERECIRLIAGNRTVAIDRHRNLVRLSSGVTLPYAQLVLATGTRSRSLAVPGANLPGVLSLRSLADAQALRERLAELRHVVVAGAGFIGLEFAAVLAGRGIGVEVIELADRPMARAVSPEMSQFFLGQHEARGTVFSFGSTITSVERQGKELLVSRSRGEPLRADLLLVGVGAVPNDELAAEAGLLVTNGIVVDKHLCTADPAIFAIGDCAAHPNPHAGAVLRIESVQNAVDQARSLAALFAGRPAPYAAVPWFWSDQGVDKLQIAGFTAGSEERVVQEADGKLAVFCFRGGCFTGLETVNRPADHMLARRILAGHLTGNRSPSSADAASPGFTLKRFLELEPLSA